MRFQSCAYFALCYIRIVRYCTWAEKSCADHQPNCSSVYILTEIPTNHIANKSCLKAVRATMRTRLSCFLRIMNISILQLAVRNTDQEQSEQAVTANKNL